MQSSSRSSAQGIAEARGFGLVGTHRRFTGQCYVCQDAVEWRLGRGAPVLFCSEACRREDKARWNRPLVQWDHSERLCEWCNEPFISRSPRSRYCSPQHGAKAGYLRRVYGLSRAEFTTLLERHGGLCGICRNPMVGLKNLHVDHDHVTGKVRGLLCRDCNLALGIFGDNAERLRRAARYLERGRFPEAPITRAFSALGEETRA